MTQVAEESAADPDFATEVVDDLYRYRMRHMAILTPLAVFGGVLGAHRFYVGKPFTGLLMMLSAGGALSWWIWDLFRLARLLSDFNDEESRRKEAGLPPQGLGFLPPRTELKLNAPPAWAPKRSSRARTIGTGILLMMIGFTLGTVCGATGLYEPAIILVLFVVISLTAARWKGVSTIPVLRGLARWTHRLRLYYHTVDPGNIWWLAVRPLAGVFAAIWRPKDRAEVRLYLQLGVVMALLFAAADLLDRIQGGGFWSGFGMLLAEFLQTLVYTYAFVAPAGALLTTQLLLEKRDRVVWGLSGLNLACLYLGLSVVGAV